MMVSRLCNPQRTFATRACSHLFSAISRQIPSRLPFSSAIMRAACIPFTNIYTACDLVIDHLQRSVLCSKAILKATLLPLAPLPKASLILSISASTHLLTLSLFTGAAGALAAAREANAASAGICADPYLCCCPGESLAADDADAGRVTDSVNGGFELCCRGWKCAWWMRSDEGFATWSIEEVKVWQRAGSNDVESC